MNVSGLIGVDSLLVVGDLIVADDLCERRRPHGGRQPVGVDGLSCGALCGVHIE